MTLVVDASVVVKWLLNDPQREHETDQATRLMEAILQDHQRVMQPVHWLLEVGAVLARISPATAEDDLVMLQSLDFPTDDGPMTLRRACKLAIDLQQHVFDTLYHAIALETPDTVLVTADERYLRAGKALGHVIGLSDWSPGEDTEFPDETRP